MLFRGFNNSKYGSRNNLNHHYMMRDEYRNLYKEGGIPEHRNAYTKLPSLEQALKRINVYRVLRVLFLVLGILFLIAPAIVIPICYYGLKLSSGMMYVVCGALLFVFFLGVAGIALSRAVHVDIEKCRAVIYSQDDIPQDFNISEDAEHPEREEE